jgi:orotidine-5'-phosphate decarboxylase
VRPLAALARHRHGIVCACDLDDLDAAARLVEAIDAVDGVVGYKLGSLLALRSGLAAVVAAFRKLTAKALLYDHQKAGLDIPSMGREYVAVCRDAGVDALILFPLAGPRAVEAFVGATLDAGLTPIVGGVLPLPDYPVEHGGYVAGDALARIAERAFGMGARDFIVPATDAAMIRGQASRLSGAEPVRLFLPGVGPLGGAIATAFAAAPELPTYAIIGRAIYAAADPAAAARRLAGEALAFPTAG